jgi:hypothetical protein
VYASIIPYFVVLDVCYQGKSANELGPVSIKSSTTKCSLSIEGKIIRRNVEVRAVRALIRSSIPVMGKTFFHFLTPSKNKSLSPRSERPGREAI